MGEVAQSESKGGKGGKPKGKKMSTHIDMTPMVDLAFLLLTFFMLATTFSKPRAMEIAMPMDDETVVDPPQLDDSAAFTLLIGANEKLVFYKGLADKAEYQLTTLDPHQPNALRAMLIREQNKRPKDFMVLIKPTPEAKYKTVVDIFDEMNLAKMKRYAMLDISNLERKRMDEKLGLTPQ